jgi:hypothetical protein
MKQKRKRGSTKLPKNELFTISYDFVPSKIRSPKDGKVIDRIILTLNHCEKNGHFTVPINYFKLSPTSISTIVRRELARRKMEIVFVSGFLKNEGKIISIRFKRVN